MRRLLTWIFSLKGLFLLLLILFFVIPVIESWQLETLRERAVRALEQKRGSRVIVLIHRQETVNVLGVPVVRYINVEDSEKVLRAIRFTDPNTPIDFIIHTPGGLVLAASQIAKAIKRHPAKTTVFVPHYAMSGGTLIRAGRTPDCHGHKRPLPSNRPAAGGFSCCLGIEGGRAETDR